MDIIHTIGKKRGQTTPLVLFAILAIPHLLLFLSPFGETFAIVKHLVADFVAALWIALLLSCAPRRIYGALLRLTLFLVLSLATLEVVHFCIYQTTPNDSVYISIFNTHLPEAFEYFAGSFYKALAVTALVPLAIALATSHLAVNAEKHLPFSGNIVPQLFFWIAVISFVSSCLVLNGFEKVLSRTSLAPVALIAQYYSSLSAQANADFSAPRYAFREAARTSKPESETYVLVLGESTRRSHLGLYGYHRQTTPLLSAMANDLEVYTNVISPSCHTHSSLTSSLNFAKQDGQDVPTSVIDLMNQAHFKTFWISNQVFFGRWNTPVATLAKRAKHVEFLNPEQFRFSARSYDTVVLDPFQQALNDPAPKKLIVVHLRGTHAAYRFRYPEDFTEFDGVPPNCLPHPDDEAERTINQYDTAVRYTDTIVADIIKRTKMSSPYSALLFFSDHGEELYDFRNFAGHTEASPSRYMFEIPFLLWTSELYKERNRTAIQAAQSNRDKPFVTGELTDTLQDIFGVHTEQYRPGASLLSAHYQPPESRVVAGISFNDTSNEELSCDKWRG